MSALEALKNAELDRALSELQKEIRAQPANAKLRVFLFQLLTLSGQWDRALTQLNVMRDLDIETLPMAQACQELLQCEAFRVQAFAGARSPLLFGDPEPWMALLVEALKLQAQGQVAEAHRLRSEAFEAAPTTSGTLSIRIMAATDEQADAKPRGGPEEPFEWLADADSRLGPMLEAVINGRYFWIPFQRIRSIELEPPIDLRDFVWAPAKLEWTNGGQAVAFIPTRYPGSESQSDDLIRLARKTTWEPLCEEHYAGLGQRTFATDASDYPLLEIHRIEFAEPTS